MANTHTDIKFSILPTDPTDPAAARVISCNVKCLAKNIKLKPVEFNIDSRNFHSFNLFWYQPPQIVANFASQSGWVKLIKSIIINGGLSVLLSLAEKCRKKSQKSSNKNCLVSVRLVFTFQNIFIQFI